MYSLVLMMAFSAGADPVPLPAVPASGNHDVIYTGNCTGNSHGFFHKSSGGSGCCGGSHPSFFGKFLHRDKGFGCNGGYVVNSPIVAPAPTAPAKALPAGEPIPAPKDKKQASGSDTARIVVQLPAEAKLFVDDEPTRSTSERRTLVTPSLLGGLTHTYTLRIEVNRNGRARSEVKQVDVVAGETTHVSFADPTEQVRTGEPGDPSF